MSQIIWTATDGKRTHGASFYRQVPEAYDDGAAAVLFFAARCQTVSQVSYQAADLYPAVTQGIASTANVLDCAVIVMGAANGQTIRFVILGADPSIYLSDGETVDISNPNVLGLVGSFGANQVCTRGGSIATDYLRGYRIMLPAAPVYKY